MKQIVFIGIIVIITIAAAACTPKNRETAPSLSSSEIEVESSAVETQDTEIILSMNIDFNNKIIPVNIYYSILEYVTNINKAVFDYDDITQVISFSNLQYDNETGSFYISYNDYNFDGFLDINVVIEHVNNAENNIFLYNSQTKSYVASSELSGEGSISLNLEAQTVETKHFITGSIFTSREYKWENGQFKLIGTENQEWDSTLEKYMLTIRTLLIDGSWAEERVEADPDTLKEFTWD